MAFRTVHKYAGNEGIRIMCRQKDLFNLALCSAQISWAEEPILMLYCCMFHILFPNVLLTLKKKSKVK